MTTAVHNENPARPGHFVTTDANGHLVCQHPSHETVPDQFYCGFTAVWHGATVEEPFIDKPFGEFQSQVDWLETRYDDDVRSEDAYYDDRDD